MGCQITLSTVSDRLINDLYRCEESLLDDVLRVVENSRFLGGDARRCGCVVYREIEDVLQGRRLNRRRIRKCTISSSDGD